MIIIDDINSKLSYINDNLEYYYMWSQLWAFCFKICHCVSWIDVVTLNLPGEYEGKFLFVLLIIKYLNWIKWYEIELNY